LVKLWKLIPLGETVQTARSVVGNESSPHYQCPQLHQIFAGSLVKNTVLFGGATR